MSFWVHSFKNCDKSWGSPGLFRSYSAKCKPQSQLWKIINTTRRYVLRKKFLILSLCWFFSFVDTCRYYWEHVSRSFCWTEMIFLRPKLEYACPVWHGALLERDAIALERVQGAVARSILRAPFYTSKSKLFEQLNWPSLRWRREIFCIGLFHRILHTRPPPLDSCMFPFASTNTTRSLRKPKQLILTRVHTSKYVKSFFFRSALLWNTLPAQLQNITCYHKFKTSIEEHWSAHKYSTQFCLNLSPWTIFMTSCWTMPDAKLHRSSTTCNSLSYAFSSLRLSHLLLFLLLLFLLFLAHFEYYCL